MFIDKKVIDGFEIFIKTDTYSTDAMYKIGNKEESFLNYGRSFLLRLFEFNEKLYIIKEGNNTTTVVPIEINHKNNYVTYSILMHGQCSGCYTEQQLEKMFQQNYFR